MDIPATLNIAGADLTVAVVGTGIMGRGIAQIHAAAGIRTLLFDAQAGAAQAARDYIADQFTKLAAKGRITADAARANTARIEIVADIAGLAAAQVLIEAIVEALEPKRALFAALEKIVSADAILASNTSSLQVTAIASKALRPERIAGFHYFNPVPLMKVVEVIDGVMTAPWVGEALTALAIRTGHTPVRAKDTPGFIVNHVGRGLGTESLAIEREGIADIHALDRVLKDVAGFRMGPFELYDLTGLDVSHSVIESIYNQYYGEPRYRPSPLTGQRVAAGLYGRKSDGRGFYRYIKGDMQKPAEPTVPGATVPPVWVSPVGFGAALRELIVTLGGRVESGPQPSAEALILAAPLGDDATTTALAAGLDPTRLIAVDLLMSTTKRRTIMTTPVTQIAMRDAAHALLARDNVPVTVIHDSPGFIAPRVVAHIVNIACDIAQQRIASPVDIDRGAVLGLGYPSGPLAWGDSLGPRRVLTILEAMESFYGDPRYRPSPWLKRRALLGVSLLMPEQ